MNYKQFYLSLDDNISRANYWKFFLFPYIIIILSLSVLDVLLGTFNEVYQFGYLSLSFFVLTFYSAIIISIKRLRERNHSWLILLLFIPVLQFWPLIEMLFLDAKGEK